MTPKQRWRAFFEGRRPDRLFFRLDPHRRLHFLEAPRPARAHRDPSLERQGEGRRVQREKRIPARPRGRACTRRPRPRPRAVGPSTPGSEVSSIMAR